jgi:hypothetical protein
MIPRRCGEVCERLENLGPGAHAIRRKSQGSTRNYLRFSMIYTKRERPLRIAGGVGARRAILPDSEGRRYRLACECSSP